MWAWSDYRFHIAYHRHMPRVFVIIMKQFFIFLASRHKVWWKIFYLCQFVIIYWKYKMNSMNYDIKPLLVILIHALASLITSGVGRGIFCFSLTSHPPHIVVWLFRCEFYFIFSSSCHFNAFNINLYLISALFFSFWFSHFLFVFSENS